LINDRRNDLFESQYAENKKFVDDAEKQHAGSLVFLKAIETNDLNAIKQFLLSENKGVAELNRSRTIVLMDATISMSQLLHKAKTTVRTMFERTCDILKDHKINQDSFQIQFVVYRNYNCEEDKLLQSSPWETKPDNLRTFMEKIGAEGG